MDFPEVIVTKTTGGVNRTIAVKDGYGALVATAAVVGNIGVVRQVYSLTDAVSKGYTEASEPFIYGLLKEFYTELGGDQKLYILGLADTVTMEDMVDSTEVDNLVKLLNTAKGDVGMVAIARKPAAGYAPGAAFLDADVALAVTKSKTLAQAWEQKNMPIRILIEGRVAHDDVVNAYEPKTATNHYAAVVLGGTKNDGSAAVTVALARAVKYGAHVKIGSGENGVLSVSQVYIGTDKYEDRVDMATLHDAGFMTFQIRPGSTGYYFGVDNMCSVDDQNILVYGRVLDKAQKVAAAAYTKFLETFVPIDDDGSIDDGAAAYLEEHLKTQIFANMGGQISNADVVIDPEQTGIISTSSLPIAVGIIPLGYLTYIYVNLTLTESL